MRAFIFDLDGTISDTVPYIVEISKKMCGIYNIEMSEEQIRSYIGWPLMDVGETVIGPGRGQEYSDAFQAMYMSGGEQLTAFPGMVELLRQLKASGAKVAVCTSKRRISAESTVEKVGVLPYLDALVYSELTERHKPFPDPALLAAELLDEQPEQCVFIGDSHYDIGCGNAAGMTTCAVTWGAGTAEEIAQCKPDFVLQDAAGLHSVLFSLLEK